MVSETFVPADVRERWQNDERLGCGNFLSHALEGSPAPDHPLLWLHKPFASYVGEAYETLSLRELESAGPSLRVALSPAWRRVKRLCRRISG